jgi:hypothetical protein
VRRYVRFNLLNPQGRKVGTISVHVRAKSKKAADKLLGGAMRRHLKNIRKRSKK